MSKTVMDLIERDQWVCWDDTTGRKLPISVKGGAASSTDPATWSSYHKAKECAEINGYSGVGFCFSPDDPFCGVDIDDCIVDGQITDEAQALIDLLDSYTEVSPSGTGVKIFGVCDEQYKGRNENGLEYYTKGRFFTFTEDCVNCEELRDLSWWFEKKHASRAAVETVTLDKGAEYADNRVERAERYIAKSEPCIEGQGGDSRLYMLACKLVSEFELNKADAIRILNGEYNDRCSPPWDYHDIEYKVDCAFNAASTDSMRGRLLNSEAQQITITEADEMAAGFLSNRKQEGIPKHLLWLPPNSPLSVMRDYILETSARESEALAFTGALAWYCGLIGGKVMDESGITTNLYTITLAPSSGGKQAPQDAIRAVTDASYNSKWLGGKVTSDSAIGSILKESAASLCLWDEVGLFLQKSKGGVQATITDLLLDLWGATNSKFRLKQYADSDKDIVIDRPCFGFAGWSTADHFWAGLTRMHLRDGFAGRLLVFNTGERAERKRKRYVRAPQSLVDVANAWGATKVSPFQEAGLASRPEARMMKVTDEAEEVFNALWDRVEEFTNDDEQAVWGRAPEKARKIALAFAACKGPEGVVDEEYAARACDLVSYATESFMLEANQRLTSDGSLQDVKREFLIELKRMNGVSNVSTLLRRVGCSSNQFNQALDTLEAAEVIKVERDVKGARKRIIYNG